MHVTVKSLTCAVIFAGSPQICPAEYVDDVPETIEVKAVAD
jgi:hypothetical protein